MIKNIIITVLIILSGLVVLPVVSLIFLACISWDIYEHTLSKLSEIKKTLKL